MADIHPLIVLAKNVDDLLILRTLFKALIGRHFLALDVFNKQPNEIAPVAFCIALDIGNISGNICGEGRLDPEFIIAI